MIEYLGSSSTHADANSDRMMHMMRRMLEEMFDLSSLDADFILSGNHYKDFQRLYLKISDLDRLMILDRIISTLTRYETTLVSNQNLQSKMLSKIYVTL